ncbi:hypothetical protein ACUXAV_002482 [Cupriavidus metallidurans]|jgi:hypothetical protein|uniref:FecR domain-containing protein n=1 Tax=Cupriavidus TaxID=106589 RepID=UPI00056A33DA|nr:FecR domain-containing protein [Cupriavidus metallidurans]KWW39494.1 hypothetical protein AU374_00560 [Cupriavidus metallidurans]MDE4920711.1 FecR domain-containing protein [Cupriavidus metallidurans]
MSSRPTSHRAAVGGALISLILSGSALAGPAGTQGKDFIYEVERGDTLIGLATRFMTSMDGWHLLQTLNRVEDPYRLVPGTRIRIPLSQIPVAPSTARVVFVRGQASVDGSPMQTGMALAESARIEIGPNSAATLELSDGTRVSLPAATTLQVRRLRAFARSGLTDTMIGIDKGGADSVVAPKGGGVGRYEISTPLMVTGVRGTRYRVSADDGGSRSEVIEGKVGVGAGARPGSATQVAAGYGVGVSTAGRLSKPMALLPAPVVAALPQPVSSRAVTVRWQAVPGAAGYHAGVARDAALTEWVATTESALPEAVFDDLPDGDLFLVVSALSPQRLAGRSGVQSFKVWRNPPAPFSLVPVPDAVEHGGEVAFRWAAVQDASGYELALAADPEFSQRAETRRENGVEAVRTLAVGQWWWRLRSFDARNRPGPWGDALKVTVQPAPPVPAPVDNGEELRVRWPADAGTAAATGYVLQMASDPAFSGDVVTFRTTESALSIPRPASGTYFVRVARATGTDVPLASAFSAPQRIDLQSVLRDGQGAVIVTGGAKKGVQLGAQ